MSVNIEYKTHLLSFLEPIHIEAFLKLVQIGDPSIVTFILSKKLFALLELESIELVVGYSFDNLKKISTLCHAERLSNIIVVLQRVDILKTTEYNIKDLYKYVSNVNNFISGKVPIQWGPGNNKHPQLNAYNHCIKHTECNSDYAHEHTEWEQIHKSKVKFNNIADLYNNHAVKCFYKMTDVIVHTNGRGVYMSGYYTTANIKIFIVGRYDKNVFGISSCYCVSPYKKLGRHSDKVLDIVFDLSA